MHALDPTTLEVGSRLQKGLFSREGVKLLSRGAEVTEALHRVLSRMPHTTIYAADSLEELERILATEDVLIQLPLTESISTTLPPVSRQAEPPSSGHAESTDANALRVRRREQARRLVNADGIIAEREALWAQLDWRVERGTDPLELAEADAPGWPDAERLAEYRTSRVRVCGKVLGRITAGLRTSVIEPLGLVDELIEKLRRFPQRFTQIALLSPHSQDYLAEHAYSTSALSIAIAARLQWSENDVRLAGLTGMLADVGMALLPRELRSAVRPLTEIETNRVFRHPAQGAVMLDVVEDLPELVRLAVYQHHERENGAGYPSGARGAAICDLAKVVSVADAFAAASEPRAYRPQKRPYDALEELIQLGSQGMYARRVVRALVESTGLFPVGSFVRLNTGQIGQVVGAHPDRVDRPLVSVVSKGPARDGLEQALYDLAEHQPWELHVIQAADAPAHWAA